MEPESFTQYEIASRYAYSKWFNLDINFFHIVIGNMLDTAYNEDGKYMGKQNIGEVTIKSFELGLAGSSCDWFQYRIGYSLALH